MISIFDPHLHLFDYENGDYNWLKSEHGPNWPNIEKLRRSFNETDLKLSPPFKLVGYNHVEAGFDNLAPEKELEFLRTQNQLPFSAIAFIAIDCSPGEFLSQINTLNSKQSFVGIRDITEGKDALRLSAPNVIENLTLLNEHKLIFEAQFELENIDACTTLKRYARKLPNLQFVVNHAGLPNKCLSKNWQTGLNLLGEEPNIAVKMSGFEMIGQADNKSFLRQILEHLIASFSSKRVLLASNFPVCLIQLSYHDIWQNYLNLDLPESQFKQLCHDNAVRIYMKKEL